MQVTILGLILLPLSLIWWLNPVRLIQLTFVVAPFEAAAAAVFGGFGLQLAMVPGLLVVSYIFLQYALGMRYRGERAVFAALFPLLAMLFYALLAAKMFPQVFAGQIGVFPQKMDPTAPGIAPLAPNFGNVTQSLYLTIDVLITTVVALFFTRRAIPHESIIGGYMLGGYVEVFFVFWQFASSIVGVPFPEDLLHSKSGLGDRVTKPRIGATHAGHILGTGGTLRLHVRCGVVLLMAERTRLSHDVAQRIAGAFHC